LPLLEANDIQAMIDTGRDNAMVIAPDRRGEGTNALFLRRPELIPFRFGEGSFDAHCTLAEDAGVTPHILECEGLAFDLDTREDYLELTRQVKL